MSSNLTQQTLLRLEILRTLRDLDGSPVIEATLLNQVRLTMPRPPVGTEFTQAIEHLENQGHIARVRDEKIGAIVITITTKGKLHLVS